MERRLEHCFDAVLCLVHIAQDCQMGSTAPALYAQAAGSLISCAGGVGTTLAMPPPLPALRFAMAKTH